MKTAVLGTGIMGAAMARRLLASGMAVNVWNRTRARAEPLAASGARVADTAREAAQECDVILTMLADGPAVEAAALGPDGFLKGARRGSVWLQTSTVGLEPCRRLAELAGEHGLTYVDAPVLGTKAPAEKGELLVLASGPDAVREELEPVLGAIGKKTLWLGPAGEGSRLKLVINDWLLGMVAALAETLAFARAIGADPERFLEAIDGGPIGPAYAQIKGRAMLRGSYEPSFPLSLALKDARLVLAAAEERGFDAGVTRLVSEWLERAEQLGRGSEDMAAVFEAIRADRSSSSSPSSS